MFIKNSFITFLLSAFVFIGCNTEPQIENFENLSQKDGIYVNQEGKAFTGKVYLNFLLSDIKWIEGGMEKGIPTSFKAPININKLNFRNNLFYQINSDLSYTGPFYDNNEQGDVILQGIIENGKIMSKPYVEIYENGQIKTLSFDNEFKSYFDNGQVSKLEITLNDTIVTKTYFENGNPGSNTTIILTGEIADKQYLDENPYAQVYDDNKVYVLDGTFEIFYENGQLMKSENYIYGKAEGEHIDYYQNGQIQLQRSFENGEAQGELLGFYENGQVKEKAFFIDGVQDGERIDYFKDGTIQYYRKYDNGKSVGVHYGYYDDKTPMFKNTYVDGKEEGTQYFVSSAGKRKSDKSILISNKINGIKNGEDIFGNPDFTVKGYYKNDKKQGTWVTYYDDRLTNITQYKDGKKNGLDIRFGYLYASYIMSIDVKNYIDEVADGLEYKLWFGLSGNTNQINESILDQSDSKHYELRQMSKGKIDGVILKKYNSMDEAKINANPYLSWSYYEKDIYVDGDIINRDFVAAVAEEVAVREKYGLNTELESLDLLYKKLLNEVRENDFLNTHIYPKDIPLKSISK